MQDPAESEKQLRQRVQEFYQLQVEKKFRQAEEYVAADTKDVFYNAGKPELASFRIVKVVMKDNATRAEVTVMGKVSIFIMSEGMVPLEMPTTGMWKVEGDKWVWFVDQSGPVKTPFGEMKPPVPGQAPATPSDLSTQIKSFDVNSLQRQVRVEPSAVSLTQDQPVQSVTITNGMPGPLDLTLVTKSIPGVGIELEKTHLDAGQKVKLTLTRKSDGNSSGNVRVDVSPTGATLDVGVTSR